MKSAVLARIAAGEPETSVLIEECKDLYHLLDGNGQERAHFAARILCGPAGPRLRGALLALAWTEGKHGGTLRRAGYLFPQIIRWFMEVSPETLMTDDERAALAALPDPLPVFRGAPYGSLRKMAARLSWTLSVDIARRFAGFYASPYISRIGSAVIAGVVPKSKVLAYLNERQEQEVVVDGRRVRHLREVEKGERGDPDWEKAMWMSVCLENMGDEILYR
jgi:hypothetical protein